MDEDDMDCRLRCKEIGGGRPQPPAHHPHPDPDPEASWRINGAPEVLLVQHYPSVPETWHAPEDLFPYPTTASSSLPTPHLQCDGVFIVDSPQEGLWAATPQSSIGPSPSQQSNGVVSQSVDGGEGEMPLDEFISLLFEMDENGTEGRFCRKVVEGGRPQPQIHRHPDPNLEASWSVSGAPEEVLPSTPTTSSSAALSPSPHLHGEPGSYFYLSQMSPQESIGSPSYQGSDAVTCPTTNWQL